MKWLFLISLVANFVLGYFLLVRKPEVVTQTVVKHVERPPLEKKIIEVKKKPADKRTISSKGPEVQGVHEVRLAGTFDDRELQDQEERTERDRLDFLMNELKLDQAKLEEAELAKAEYLKKNSEIFKDAYIKGRELTFDEKLRLLKVEEALTQKLERIFGEENWDKFIRFRDEYNRRATLAAEEQGLPPLGMPTF